MAVTFPPGREEAFFTRSGEDGSELRCRREFEGTSFAEALADPDSIFALDGVRIVADHTNRLATIDLPEVEGVPAKAFIKAFGRRGLLSSFRRPRSLRAWNAGCELLSRGVPTPEPLALSIPASGAWREGVLVVEFLEGRQVREYLRALRANAAMPDGADPEAFLRALGRFVRSIHDAGVFHGDLGGGNIIVTGSGAAFALVDVTRCRIGPSPGRMDRLRDLARIRLPVGRRGPLIESYAAVEPRIEGIEGQDRLVHPLYRSKLTAKRQLWRVVNFLRGRGRPDPD